ncbi:MAG: hypothetical protein HYY49_02590 [Ignavibacteriales bacterium]|nr:hypothetical protein [Ignavibacteriales bacterium]
MVWKSLTLYYLMLGLDLSGSVVGLNMENQNAIYEFTLATKPYGYTAFSLYGIVDNFAKVGYVYTQPNVQRIVLSGRGYVKDNFEFLGAHWKWGLGAGMNLELQNERVRLIDSTVVNALGRVESYGSLGSFFIVYFDRSYADGLKLAGDMRLRWPVEGQITMMFMIGL